eukprot:TRINITY_DN19449_c0_g1_i2.p1 TRINITY_DN19449_c0_g1~~TRINITY_DN19449_c0_g1_i2.p1  ORF type:complete len:164 (-),score=28.08 TRINITY_DN19449_c0_g1_i2:237-728(-)
MKAEGGINLLWAGMSLGVMFDAGAKFSTPLVAKHNLLRVGMHLFRCFRTVELATVGLLAVIGASCFLQGGASKGASQGQGLQRATMGAMIVCMLSSYIFPMPYLLEAGDYKIACMEAGVEPDPSKYPWLKVAHPLVVGLELLKILLLVLGANRALTAAHKLQS